MEKDKIIAIVSSVFITTMVLFPPTQTTVLTPQGTQKVFAGYRFIGTLESYQESNQMPSSLNRDIKRSVSIYSIESTRLVMQLFSALTISFLLIWTFKKQTHESGHRKTI